MIQVALEINGEARELRGHPMSRLLDVLREAAPQGGAGLTGTKEGCGEGECGACGVLLDGQLVNSCLIPLAQCDGARVSTIEGVTGPLPEAFLRAGGAQCGICTPGMILAARRFLDTHPAPARASDAEIREALAGNLCRCTGYMKIIDAVRLAAGS